MTKREQERLLTKLARAKDAIQEADVELMAFARQDVDDALAAIGRIETAVEQAR